MCINFGQQRAPAPQPLPPPPPPPPPPTQPIPEPEPLDTEVNPAIRRSRSKKEKNPSVGGTRGLRIALPKLNVGAAANTAPKGGVNQ